MFVFDFIKIFMLDEVKFTDGNLAKNPNIFNNIDDLQQLNFQLIYHRTWFMPEDRDEIINARHSEILVKNKLLLKDNLKLLVVRSEAEKETLLYQINDDLKSYYQKKIFIQPKTGIFTNDWFYINSVSIINNEINIVWHYCSKNLCNDKFKLKIIVKNLADNSKKSLKKAEWYPNTTTKISLPEEFINRHIELSILIDDIKAYINSFDDI